jgi:hypothetical protein
MTAEGVVTCFTPVCVSNVTSQIYLAPRLNQQLSYNPSSFEVSRFRADEWISTDLITLLYPSTY